MMWENAVVTDAGEELLLRMANQEGKLIITKATGGTGTVSAEEMRSQTALTDEKQTLSLVFDERVEHANRYKIQIQANETSYPLNQVGIFAQLNEEEEVLFALFQDNTGIQIPSQSEMQDFVFNFYAVIGIDDNAEIQVVIDTNAFVTMETITEWQNKFDTQIQDAGTQLDERLEGAAQALREAQKQAEKTVQDAIQKMDDKLTEADLTSYSLKSDLDTKADAKHTHAADTDITGILPVEHGGTGNNEGRAMPLMQHFNKNSAPIEPFNVRTGFYNLEDTDIGTNDGAFHRVLALGDHVMTPTGYSTEIAFGYTSGTLHPPKIRQATTSKWTDWATFYTTANKPTAADIGAAFAPISVAVTTDGWAEAEGVYSHAFTATGVNATANMAYIANLVQQGNEAIDEPARGAWSTLIRGAVTAKDTVTLWATDAPTAVINMQLVPVATKAPVAELIGILGGGGSGGGRDLSKAVVTLDYESFTYDTKPHSPQVTKVQLGDTVLESGTDYYVICDQQTNAGTYILTVAGILEYSGGVQKEWTVTKAADVITLSAETATVKGVMGTVNESVTVSHKSTDALTAAVANGSDGGSVTASITSGKVKLTSVKAGTCTVTVKSAGDNNYTGASKTLTVTVQKADGKISVSPDTIEIMGEIGTTKTAVLTISAGDAASAVTFTGGTDNVTCSYTAANKTITLKSVKETSVAVDVTVHLAAGDNYSEATCVMHVSVKTYSSTLENNTWAQIAAAAAEGKAESLWQLGDTKAVQIGSDTYHAQIIGFDHDDLYTADTSYNKGTNKAGITFQLQEVYTTSSRMDETDSNACSWRDSEMRTTTLKGLLGKMPADIKNNMRKIKKQTATSGTNTALIATEDQLFLLSEVEVFGTSDLHSATGEGKQYDFYAAGNSKIKKKLTGSANSWWLRSPRSSNSYSFVSVISDGSWTSGTAYYASGVAFGFCV